jgi:mRNA interferase MazF
MVKAKVALRGEIWLIELDPTIGSEIRKTRPCLIVSPDGMNRFLNTVIGLPLTTAGSAARFRLQVRFKNKAGLVLGDQVRTLDRKRLVKRLGLIDAASMTAVLAVLREMFEE